MITAGKHPFRGAQKFDRQASCGRNSTVAHGHYGRRCDPLSGCAQARGCLTTHREQWKWGLARAILRKHRLWAAIQPDLKQLSPRSDIGQAISRDEEAGLLAAARNSRSRSLYPALVVAIHTDLRSAELRTLQWSRVDLIDAHLTLAISKTAGGERKGRAALGNSLDVLKEWRAQFPRAKPVHYVFPSERVGLDGQDGKADGRLIPYDTDPTKPIGS